MTIDEIFEIKVDDEPKPDIAYCSYCGRCFSVSECGTDIEGDWESGEYEIHTCPKCPNGGVIDDYDMSSEREKEWQLWHNKKNAAGLLPAAKVTAER